MARTPLLLETLFAMVGMTSTSTTAARPPRPPLLSLPPAVRAVPTVRVQRRVVRHPHQVQHHSTRLHARLTAVIENLHLHCSSLLCSPCARQQLCCFFLSLSPAFYGTTDTLAFTFLLHHVLFVAAPNRSSLLHQRKLSVSVPAASDDLLGSGDTSVE